MRFVLASGLMMACAIGCNKTSTADGAANNRSQQNSASTNSSAVRKDNTAVNERDRSGTTKTPLDQHENKHDVEITAKIRKRVVDTKMSSNAHNSKIITEDGKVTLRGPVANAEEKDEIAKIATDVAGAGNVDNQLEVQP